MKELIREKIELIIYGDLHQGEYDTDLPIYGQDKAIKKLVKLFEKSREEEREMIRKIVADYQNFKIDVLGLEMALCEYLKREK